MDMGMDTDMDMDMEMDMDPHHTPHTSRPYADNVQGAPRRQRARRATQTTCKARPGGV